MVDFFHFIRYNDVSNKISWVFRKRGKVPCTINGLLKKQNLRKGGTVHQKLKSYIQVTQKQHFASCDEKADVKNHEVSVLYIETLI